jgi:hypothetical protein
MDHQHTTGVDAVRNSSTTMTKFSSLPLILANFRGDVAEIVRTLNAHLALPTVQTDKPS